MDRTPSPRGRQLALGIACVLTGWLSITLSQSNHLTFRVGPLLIAVAVIIGVIGLALRVAAFAVMPSTHHIESLVTTGVFGRIRHPIYTAFALMILAVAVASGAALAWLWLALSAALFVIVALAEESDLLRRFGDEYREYQHAVPMFFPRLRPRRPRHREGSRHQ